MARSNRDGRSGRAPGLSDAALAARSGRSVAEWFEILDAEAATRLSHDQIVALVTDVYEAPEWGAQSVAVRYEQERGMRLPGQQPDGTFEVSASRSIRGPQLALLELAVERASSLAEAAPDEVHRLPERCVASWTLANGDLLVARVTAPANDRCAVTLTESRIRLPELVAQTKRRLERAVEAVAASVA
ncbi:hypothetical protein AS850_03405 [Frondihabitans sp. 762G35]|uniref:hypothetical protein n=1 Tax=Frondihabitans sp. 762G35 TaxID=1446794 RepID=UPI000D211F04|nr:hypothetical protein [Frondihabitans sp. 762G35]ARC56121.1 hypothetical protein AS850_03405 [Frondihabitans sp. 762G35]